MLNNHTTTPRETPQASEHQPIMSPETKTETPAKDLKGKKLGKPHLRLRMPAQLGVVRRHFSTWIVIAGLIAVTVETIYVFNRGPDPHLQLLVKQRYPTPAAQFNQEAINRLNNLLPQAQVPPASGKPNPFVP